MFEELTATCDRCDRELDGDALGIVYRTDGGERRAYDCACGATTITVSR
jgi:hypothetical protein